jgi:A/G-specific adenine glycosylase
VLAASAPLDRALPWSVDRRSWGVLVSEVMLQQTQVARVTERWAEFMAAYPDPASLAAADLRDVLGRWRGLGYPRRARALREAARVITRDHGGAVPSDLNALLALPGVGDYTARAVMAFAFGERAAVVDTNVGRVLARAVAGRALGRKEAQELADALIGDADPAQFNQTMLDLGARHCRAVASCEGCPLARLCQWRRSGGEDPAATSAGVSRRQARFAGSDREARGMLLRELEGGPLTRERADEIVGASRAQRIITSLIDDELIVTQRGRLRLAR